MKSSIEVQDWLLTSDTVAEWVNEISAESQQLTNNDNSECSSTVIEVDMSTYKKTYLLSRAK